MAVQKSRVTPSRRGMRRAHDKLQAQQLSTDPTTGETVAVTSLADAEGMRRIVGGIVPNIVEFPPMGVVLVVMLGVAVADGAGLINTALRVVVAKVPARWLTFVLALAGVTGPVWLMTASKTIRIPFLCAFSTNSCKSAFVPKFGSSAVQSFAQ